ncbi:hypothetical protein TRIP_C10002 [Candidatus Zixiibacteriota bacterium]|nr:hypothetical protein TRIP_C10002 [candidate division Zixibacteria bacterium]
MDFLNTITNHKSLRWIMRSYKIPLIVISILIALGEIAGAQVIDTSYYIDVGDFKALPDSVARVPVQIKNPADVGGFIIRFTYDTTALTPYMIEGSSGGPNIVYDSLELFGRGLLSTGMDSCAPSPADWRELPGIFAPRDTSSLNNPNRNAIFVQFLPPLPPLDTTCFPYFRAGVVPAKADTVGGILYFLFKVKPTIAVSKTKHYLVQVQNSTSSTEFRENQFSSVDGTITVYPRATGILGYGYFTCDTAVAGCPDGFHTCPTGCCPDTITCPSGYHICGDTCCPDVVGNHAPVVTDPVPSTYSIMQGETVTFTIAATDVDAGDVVTLEAVNLPSNATFSSTPGTQSASGLFSFTPSFTQEGTFPVGFKATDDNAAVSTIKYVTITVNKVLKDRLFSTSSYGTGTRPNGGVPGATPVIFPIDLISAQPEVYGIQFDMSYPGEIAQIDSVVVTTRTPEYVVYENIGSYPDSIRVFTFGLSNEPILPADTISKTAVLKAYMSIDSAATAGDYPVRLFNGWESVDPNPEIASLALVTDSGLVQVDRYGDVNLDKMINVADLVNVVAYIIGNFGLPVRNFATANINFDAVVNVVDLVGIINMILGQPMSPSPAPVDYYNGQFATMKIEHGDLESGQLTNLNVRGEFPDQVAGVQLQVDYDPDALELGTPVLPEAAKSLVLAYNDDHKGRLRMVLYSRQTQMSSMLIPAGASDVVRLEAKTKRQIKADDNTTIRITKAYLSNARAVEIPMDNPNPPIVPTTFMLYQNYPNPFNPTTTIEFDIAGTGGGVTNNAKLKIYNILGQQVRTLVDGAMVPGRHTVIWDGTDQGGHGVATGIYFYRLEVGGKSQTKKMLLVK